MSPGLDLSQDHFEMFGLQARFEIPLDTVESTYRDLQRRVHPDRFAHAGDAERRVSMQWSTRVNEAYQVLKSPLKRARYLLELHGIEVGEESNTAMPEDFLRAQLEWREAIEDAQEDSDKLERLSHKLQREMRAYYDQLRRQLDELRDYETASHTVRKLMFMQRLQDEIGESIAGTEP